LGCAGGYCNLLGLEKQQDLIKVSPCPKVNSMYVEAKNINTYNIEEETMIVHGLPFFRLKGGIGEKVNVGSVIVNLGEKSKPAVYKDQQLGYCIAIPIVDGLPE